MDTVFLVVPTRIKDGFLSLDGLTEDAGGVGVLLLLEHLLQMDEEVAPGEHRHVRQAVQVVRHLRVFLDERRSDAGYRGHLACVVVVLKYVLQHLLLRDPARLELPLA